MAQNPFVIRRRWDGSKIDVDDLATGCMENFRSLSVALQNPFPEKGVSDGSSAESGYIGEYVESVVQAVAAGATGVYKNITSISLTSGDWDVSGIAVLSPSGGSLIIGPNTLSVDPTGAPTPGGLAGDVQAYFVASNTFTAGATVPPKRFSLTTGTTMYLVCFTTYTVSAPNWYGRISARRVR